MTNNQIRPDLADIANTVNHLLLLSKDFRKKWHEWGRIWYTEHKNRSLEDIYEINDQEFIDSVEGIYSNGRGLARNLGDLLEVINYIEDCPKLKEYVDCLKSYQHEIDEHNKKIIDCRNLIQIKKHYRIDYYAINEMLELYSIQIEILRNLDNDIIAIEQSERYGIENRDILEKIQAKPEASTNGNSHITQKGWHIENGQVFYDGEDLGFPSGQIQEVFEKLIESEGNAVPYNELKGLSSLDQLRHYKSNIIKIINSHNLPFEVKTVAREGYILKRK